ncbi:MAG: Wzz/FepE/Etk N-terminal domain-containing protein [Candidatus Acidiferrales bacterium]
MNEMAIQPNESRAGLALTLRDVVAPVFRKRRMATLLFLGIFVGAILAMLLLPRKYEAEMKILVNRERVDAVVTPNPDSPVAAEPMTMITEEDLNSEVELLKSRDLLEQVVLICGLESQEKSAWDQAVERATEWMRRAPMTGEALLARSVQTLEDRLVVDPLKKTTLIRVAYTARDPELAARVLQTLAVHYQEKHAAVHRPAGTFTFFDQETEHYRNELAIAEAQLTNFNSEEGIVSAPEQKQLVLQQLSQFEAELQQAQANATEARERARALKVQVRATPDRQTTQMKKLDNAQLFSQLESTLLSLELKHTEMLMKYAPSYPPVQEVETQITNTRAAIVRAGKTPVEEVITDRPPAQDWMATELAKAETDGAALQAQAIETARIVRHYRDVAQKLDEKGIKQDDFARNVKTSEENYLLYLRKREEARISDALDRKRIVNVSIAEAATIPALPTLHLAWVLIGGFFAAGIVSVGSAYAVDRLDPSFRTPDELSRYLDVKVLASIPENVKKQ